MNIDQFDYLLPPELVAQEPAAQRDRSRLLVVSRNGEPALQDVVFSDLAEFLNPQDLLVMNDARVIPARLWAHRATGGLVEILLLRPTATLPVWEALLRPSSRIKKGEALRLLEDVPGVEAGALQTTDLTLVDDPGGERRLVAFAADCDVIELLKARGEMPLPPYIRRARGDARATLDRGRYQTVYATADGSVAAPTAGLHFTEELLARLRAAGVETATLTLNVGPGTFQPVRVEEVGDHTMEAEDYVLPPACVGAIEAARCAGGRVIGVGTTVVRTLEHAAREHGDIMDAAGQGSADVFIYPGFEFRVVDAMLTNFHLPRSTPILMVAALAGRERLAEAYEYAVANEFRFYSYGDSMLIQ